MNWDQFEGKWEQMKGQVKEQWGKLTDNDITTIKGKKQQLLGKLQERYGYASDQAEKEVDRFMSKCGCSDSDEMSDRSERDTTMKVGRH